MAGRLRALQGWSLLARFLLQSHPHCQRQRKRGQDDPAGFAVGDMSRQSVHRRLQAGEHRWLQFPCGWKHLGVHQAEKHRNPELHKKMPLAFQPPDKTPTCGDRVLRHSSRQILDESMPFRPALLAETCCASLRRADAMLDSGLRSTVAAESAGWSDTLRQAEKHRCC